MRDNLDDTLADLAMASTEIFNDESTDQTPKIYTDKEQHDKLPEEEKKRTYFISKGVIDEYADLVKKQIDFTFKYGYDLTVAIAEHSAAELDKYYEFKCDEQEQRNAKG